MEGRQLSYLFNLISRNLQNARVHDRDFGDTIGPVMKISISPENRAASLLSGVLPAT
jgi:hypothetical protein